MPTYQSVGTVTHGTPTNVKATGSKGAATVTWSGSTNPGGAPIIGYRVTTYDQFGAGDSVDLPASARSASITGLDNGLPVSFVVRANNSGGYSPQSTASPVIIPPFSSAASFIKRMALDFLGRNPTTAETNAALPYIHLGISPGATAYNFRKSSDGTTTVDPTARLYFAYMQRIPDKGGFQFWLGKKRSGWTLARMSQTFATSSEFINKYGALTNRQFVTLIYTDVMQRPADAAGVNYWTAQLDTKKKNRGEVMIGFSESSEYKHRKAAEVDVAVTMISMLQANPDPTEYANNVTFLKSGNYLAALAAQILKDPRFTARF